MQPNLGMEESITETQGWKCYKSFLLSDCGNLNDPANGAVDTAGGTTYGETATYTCDMGYEIQGVATRLCEATGLWADTEPTCAIKG